MEISLAEIQARTVKGKKNQDAKATEEGAIILAELSDLIGKKADEGESTLAALCARHDWSYSGTVNACTRLTELGFRIEWYSVGRQDGIKVSWDVS